MPETGVIITLGVTIAGALIWLIRLEGRVNLNETVTKALSEDVRYIRTRIDAALSGVSWGKRRDDHDLDS